MAKLGTTSVGGADGVAIWTNSSESANSTVIGADPAKGLTVFALDGSVIQNVAFANGGAAEVDVRYNFPLNGKTISLSAGGVRNGNRIYAYKIDPSNGHLENILVQPAPSTGVNPYGSCMYKSKISGKYFLFITSQEGDIEQYELFDNGHGQVDAREVRTFKLRDGSDYTVEACVADDQLGRLYLAQENECKIWRYYAEPDADDTHVLVDNAQIKDEDNVEGLAIYHRDGTSGYLIASVQGSWKYKVYTRQGQNKYLGTFDIITAGKNQIVQSHDCIEVTNLNLGPLFPNGLFVTQNANNLAGNHYQLVPWESIATVINTEIENRQ
ncbi:MAG: phytase [Planctomycetes bacterium]|nr:phytase [Planctomycetota bacterium]